MQITRSKWFQPSFSVGLGLLFLVALWIGGDLRGGVYALVVMAAFGGLILLGGRSETVRGLRGNGSRNGRSGPRDDLALRRAPRRRT